MRRIAILLIAVVLAACAPAPADDPLPTITATDAPTLIEEIATMTPATAPTDAPPLAGEPDADVTYVRAVESPNGTWTFYVTVEHPDAGWENYTDGWDVVLPDGTVIKPDPDSPFTRLLLHPHVNEQPFTRSQSNITIPDGVTTVTVRAHDIVDGFGGAEITIDLTQTSGDGYEVERQS